MEEFDSYFSTWYESRWSIETKSLSHKKLVYEGWKAKTNWVVEQLTETDFLTGCRFNSEEEFTTAMEKQAVVDNLRHELS